MPNSDTLDIPVWDTTIKYKADLFCQPETTQTVLYGSEAVAKREVAQLLPTLIGRPVGMAHISEILETRTRERVLVLNVTEAQALLTRLQEFLKAAAGAAETVKSPQA